MMISIRPPLARNSSHEERVLFLDAIAVLLRCTGSISCALPDGRRPDVLRFDQPSGRLLLGEAKDTESPKCHDTAVRFQRYLQWIAAHVEAESHLGMVAVCFGKEREGSGWLRLLDWLSTECSLRCTAKGLSVFGRDLFMAWSLHVHAKDLLALPHHPVHHLPIERTIGTPRSQRGGDR